MRAIANKRVTVEVGSLWNDRYGQRWRVEEIVPCTRAGYYQVAVRDRDSGRLDFKALSVFGLGSKHGLSRDGQPRRKRGQPCELHEERKS